MAKLSNFRKVSGLYFLVRGFYLVLKAFRVRHSELGTRGTHSISRGVSILGLDNALSEVRRNPLGASLSEECFNLHQSLSREALEECKQPGTLGNILWQQYNKGLDPKFYLRYSDLKATQFQSDVDLHRYLAYQLHDIHHVLTGYPTTTDGEIAIIMFDASQTGAYGTLLISLAVAIGKLIKFPRELQKTMKILVEAWQAGQNAMPLRHVHFSQHMNRDLAELRETLRIPRAGFWTEAGESEFSSVRSGNASATHAGV